MIFRERKHPAPKEEHVELIKKVGIAQAATEIKIPVSTLRRAVTTWACRRITLQLIEAWYAHRTTPDNNKLAHIEWAKKP